MADLLAKQKTRSFLPVRGQQVEGIVVSTGPHEVILDLGTKAEGILQKKDLSPEQAANLKIGDKLLTFVITPENESGQVVLGLHKAINKGDRVGRWKKFEEAKAQEQTLVGKGIEVNKGGLIVEIAGVRGFLPSSQVSLSLASNLEELIGREVTVAVIEVDSSQNRLIFSQKTSLSDDVKAKLGKLTVGDIVKGEVAAVLPFGIFVSLPEGVEGLVHISELSWEREDDLAGRFRVGDEATAKIIALDQGSGRVNLSIKQLSEDPLLKKMEQLVANDITRGKVLRVTSLGIFVELPGGLEGLVPASKLEPEADYQIGDEATFLVDSVDSNKRRINLAPFITTTKGLIYK